MGWKLPPLSMVLYGGGFNDAYDAAHYSAGDQRDQCVCFLFPFGGTFDNTYDAAPYRQVTSVFVVCFL